ncbi:basic leucine zipper transcriptional factor ATF-like [Cyprinus carpio]|uniref:Basic leucine zipper transcriptional factor ATF-like n=1 Tax=Cyprinus carpio TaxID=7962 RepID=A0A9Q9VCI8_CYPCA|nr:basic leucine zipper transcriptional factor ATF-like [Cyprinus carpio]XP_042615794.1 basic leucine zipper transcriptional factor ATF-like [Cyprinus carpio]
MPAALMDNFDQGSPFSQSDSQSPHDWSTQSKDHRHHHREKNRDAARKSRRKHTEKADLLHEELQNLEQSNATFVKEIAELKKELQLYTTALEQHIPHCTKLCPFEPSVTVTGGPSTATPSTSDITFSTDPNFLPDLAFLPESNSAGISLTDLLDSSDWYPWDSVNGNGCLQQF